MIFIKKATHNCLESLQNLTENQSIKYRVLKEENEELRQINENQKNFYLEKIRELEKKNAELIEEVKNGKTMQEKINSINQKEKKMIIAEYEAKIYKLQETTFQKISHYRQKSEEHFKDLSKNIQNSVLNYLENAKDNTTNFNNRLQADSNDLILSKSMEINNNNSRLSSPGNTKKILNQSLQNSSFSNKKGSSGKQKLGNSCLLKL